MRLFRTVVRFWHRATHKRAATLAPIVTEQVYVLDNYLDVKFQNPCNSSLVVTRKPCLIVGGVTNLGPIGGIELSFSILTSADDILDELIESYRKVNVCLRYFPPRTQPLMTSSPPFWISLGTKKGVRSLWYSEQTRFPTNAQYAYMESTHAHYMPNVSVGQQLSIGAW